MQSGDTIPAHDRYLAALFGEGGYLSRAFANYQPRPGQIALAEAVDRAIVGRGHLLAEAPTGVGKSLAYSGPASYHAWASGRRVVIVTANIALQEQIVSKDLPLLQRLVPWDFTFSLLKGRNNYLCLDRLASYQQEHINPSSLTGEERRQLPIVEQWAHASAAGGLERKLGDASELPFEPLGSVWRRFSVASDECKRGRCKHRSDCFAIAASERAREAMVIVTNYHMFYAHLAVYLDAGVDAVITPFDAAILDEAHKAPDIARDVFGFRISAGTLHRMSRKVRREDEELGERLDNAAVDFFFLMSDLAKNRDRYKARLTGNYNDRELKAWALLEGALAESRVLLEEKIRTLGDEVREKLEGATVLTARLEKEVDDLNDQIGDAEVLLARVDAARSNLAGAMDPLHHPRGVFFLEEDERRRVSVSSRLIYASDALTPGLFEKVVSPPSGPTNLKVAVVATSATLTTGADSFDYVAEELGCPPGYDALVAPSPFNWPEQCLFICPTGLPEPNAPEFKDIVADRVERVIRLARGRTLGLFTSRRVLEHTFDKVLPACRSLGITLLRQGDAPRTKLIETFKRDISSVLLGTESFWAGVDVPGEALSVVVIDRLPFPTPDDPVLEVHASRSDNWFQRYSIPRALIAFKQGFGRLIRSLECHGVVVCLDNRLVEKRYGKQFLRAIPRGVPKSQNLDAIADWLGLPVPEAAPLPSPAAAASSPATPHTPDAPPTLTRVVEPPPPPQLSLFLQPPRPIAAVLPPGWDDVEAPSTIPPPAPALAWDEL